MSECEKCIHYCVCMVNSYCHVPCGYYEEKRPHGEWVEKGHYTYCSECGKECATLYNFCPNCGSDNRKRGEEK